jgi:hypothetical protein
MDYQWGHRKMLTDLLIGSFAVSLLLGGSGPGVQRRPEKMFLKASNLESMVVGYSWTLEAGRCRSRTSVWKACSCQERSRAGCVI